MSNIELFNVITGWCALVMTGMILILAAVGQNKKEKVFRCFFVIVLLNFWLMINDAAIYHLQGHTSRVIDVLIRILDFFSYAIEPIQIIALALYLHEYLNTKTTASKTFVHLIIGISACTLILLVGAQFNSMYTWFDEMNYYHKQDTFWISEIPLFISCAIFTVVVLRHTKALPPKELASLLSYFAVLSICRVLEIFIFDLWLYHIGAIVAIFLIYVNIQMNLKRQSDAQKAELTENRIAIMLSQIKPHFLYNALNTIDDLYYDNPDAGHEAMLAFSEYLRGNMESLSQKNLIPFERELEHTRQYLLLESLRFEERLQIVYDIQTDSFMLPVLSLQPIVENAVRHGITKKAKGGVLTIQTLETEDYFRISVKDNGVGFNVNVSNQIGRTHTGITNVRNRLEAMCGGRLMIASTPGIGTAAIIEIPKQRGLTS